MLTDIQTRKLTKLFRLYDANADGILEQRDFIALATRLANLRQGLQASPHYEQILTHLQQDWLCLCKAADQNYDARITLKEWLTYYEQILDDIKQYASRVIALVTLLFAAFDQDNDGQISEREWIHLLSLFNVLPIYASSIFLNLDVNQDGVLSQDEVLTLIHDFFYINEPSAPANFMFGPY
ncbi:calcium-binding ef-hand-containing protein [Leptolyngbya sp. Heron Island J]|uniref:EF-hand domain-containing protein n=1 Tax=Leptolyngbya sp. Heron Island J TaxID=1385935 RepID=UPI0003B9F42F|nr:EF-hand domain-containing protein [Leptolyngbya sp. Heron Island J]ESA38392.1 calcium-binding ef-hand-containing protein [Leptolyngbya sp. Heron Island J]